MLQAVLLSAMMALAPAASSTAGGVHVQPVPTPQFRHYGVSDGLPSSNVYTLKQDAQGVIWMGTANGLVRFDGNHFRVFRHDPRNTHSLAANDVSAVLIDSRQRLWVGGGGTGLNLYRPASGDFKTWMHHDADPDSLAGNDIGALAEGIDGSIWISVMGRGLDRLLPDGQIQHLRHARDDPDSILSNIVLSLKACSDGSVLIGSGSGLDRHMPDGRMRHIRFQGTSGTLRVWSIDGAPGDLRLSTSEGLYRLDGDDVARRMAARIIDNVNVTSSLRMPNGDLWVGSKRSGLYWIGRNGQHRHFPARQFTPKGFPGRLVWDLMRDHEGGVWATTFDGGVAYLRPDWRQFTVFEHHPGRKGSLSMTQVRAQARFKGKLWATGTTAQLDRLDPATGAIEHGQLGKGDHPVAAMSSAGRGALWIAYGRSLILQQQDGKRRFMQPRTLVSIGSIGLVSDHQGNAYLLAFGGTIYRADRTTFKVDKVPMRNPTEEDGNVTRLRFGHHRVWRSSMGGLARTDKTGKQFVGVPGVKRGRIIDFSFDTDGKGLWLVRPNSLQHYILHAHRIQLDRVVGVDQGWPEINVVNMFCDHRGRVWMTSHTGLWRYDPDSGAFRSYGVQDGLPSPEFVSKTMTRMPDGTVYSGTLNGLVGWNPERMSDTHRQPHLTLEAVTVRRDGKRVNLATADRTLRLRWNDSDLQVVAQALSYLNPERNHYRFRLVGLDASWVDTGTHGERDFTGIGHGSYTLKIEAAGPDDVWAALPPLHIRVDRPPWDTPWAWAVYAVFALVLAWLLLMLVKRRIEQRHRFQMADRERAMAEQASAAKSSFLATLGHEIRTPMTGVLGMAELLLRSPLEPRQRGYAETIQRSGTLLLRLVNEALDMARIEAGRLELELSDLDPRALLEDVVQLESGVARDKGLSLRAEVAADVPARLRGDPLRIKQVLLNLVNNALKFTEHGGIELGLRRVDGGFQFTVSDTGPGIPEASRERLFQRYEQADGPQRSSGTGLGLAICRELVALMEGRFTLQSSSAEGSTFSAWLPLPVVAEVAPETVQPASNAPASRRVLLIEDDPTVADVIKGLLETSGHAVQHAADGLAGLVELERGTFDVLLLDLDLPGVDGFGIARMVREREAQGQRLPIIAITARSGGDEEEHARAAGMDGFLRKPLSGDQLEAEFARVLD